MTKNNNKFIKLIKLKKLLGFYYYIKKCQRKQRIKKENKIKNKKIYGGK